MTYGYLRVSTDRQDENNQRQGVEAKARKMGISIDEFVIDAGVSGTKEPEKRKLGGLLDKLQAGDVIIASELSRLGRSLYMVMRILEHCMKQNVKVITVKDNYELGDNVQSKVLAFAFALAAEIERDMISQRTKEALAKKMREGLMVGRPRGRRTGCRKLVPYHNQIVDGLKNGESYSGLAKKLGVHRNTLKGYCSEHKIDDLHNKAHDKSIEYRKQRPLLEAATTLKELLDLIKQGMTYNDIGRKFGIHPASVRNYIQGRPGFHNEYVKIQDGKRIKSNGGLRINKAYLGITQSYPLKIVEETNDNKAL
jgi:DNA invertase Pin-like site-specific DNA recombinase